MSAGVATFLFWMGMLFMLVALVTAIICSEGLYPFEKKKYTIAIVVIAIIGFVCTIVGYTNIPK